jgi:hypothetical protein
MDKKKFQLEFFTQFIEERGLEEKWKKFQEENTFELAKIFRSQTGIKNAYNEFLVDALGIDPSTPNLHGFDDPSKPSLTATEVNVLLQSDGGQRNLRKWGYLKDEKIETRQS